ncbi:hypothetical protein FB451DRAFT_1169391 [Mycena latifolia]|nr:hypothetical protein FB451DRAFT_1169391 [Mycena latifolia]
MSSPEQSAELFAAIGASRPTNYSVVAALTFLIYDALLCFPKEVEYIWKYLILTIFPVSNLQGLSENLSGLSLVELRVSILLSQYVYHFMFYHSGGPTALYSNIEGLLRGIAGVLPVPDTMKHLLPGCTFVPRSVQSGTLTFTIVGWVPSLVFAGGFYALTVAKLFSPFNWNRKLSVRHNLAFNKSFSPLLVKFLSDGSVFFLFTSVRPFPTEEYYEGC